MTQQTAKQTASLEDQKSRGLGKSFASENAHRLKKKILINEIKLSLGMELGNSVMNPSVN